MKHSDLLINEAVFFELGQKQWRKGLWQDLQQHKADLEATYLQSLEYEQQFPNSPDAWSHSRALGRILDSVTESYRTLELYREQGAK